MTFSANDDAMSEFADGDFELSDSGNGGDIFKSIRATENSKLSNQKQVRYNILFIEDYHSLLSFYRPLPF
jgi:hypothetical protein